ncbi:DNA binding domain, excisionase family [Pannonibacter phragmitetus]|uniref:DNA binding domain, excisionase family n=1 Tax=Pannonibacter phragmitetus TaxID=121719 RepID=A0A379A0R0_9HYPH|nr:helix-turn-helix domain-containing protein [Pannonibacter phragmitetus]SUB02958.1 DNA binding domain, excisionase family [Pannonibacter phragmitetus]
MPCETYQTVREVADRLKIAEATVRHWIKAGELRAIDIGKGWRIADADLAEFLRRHETVPRAPGQLAEPHEEERTP